MTALTSEFSAQEVQQFREDTPGISSRIHLDNCGSALMSRFAVGAMQAYQQLEIDHGGYVAQEQQSVALESVYGALSQLLGGKEGDYALAGSAVDAWAKAFYSIPMKAGDNIVTAYNEYCSNYVSYLQRAKRDGVEIRVAKAAPDGSFDLKAFEALIDENTRLLSLTHVPSSSGQIAPAEEVGKIAKREGKLFLLDACQSVGQLPVKFEKIGCHMATATGRKFLRGPRGIGFLYINEEARQRIDPVVLTNQAATWTSADAYELRTDARVFEAWERSFVNQMGLGAALNYILEVGVERISSQLHYLSDYLRRGLASIPGVVPTCQKDAAAAIVTFNKEGLTAAEIKSRMAEEGIAVQVASVVHTRLDLEARGIDTTVRLSPHVYNTKDELDRFLNKVEAL